MHGLISQRRQRFSYAEKCNFDDKTLFNVRETDLLQLPLKMSMASSTLAPCEMMAWQAAVIRTASSVDFW